MNAVRRAALAVLATLALTAPVLAPASADDQPHNDDAVKVLITGDSITQGKVETDANGVVTEPNTWRSFVWQDIESAGLAETVDFVGPKTGPNVDLSPAAQDPSNYANPDFDYDHAAVAGAELCKPTALEGQESIEDLMDDYDPDIVVGLWGTNDLRRTATPASLIGCYTAWLDAARAHNPNVGVLVARLPWTFSDPDIAAFNTLLVAWAADNNTATSRVVVTVMDAPYSAAVDTYDNLHPNVGGERKIADMMGSGLKALGIPIVADPILTPPSSPPALSAYRVGTSIEFKWTLRTRATTYVIRCGGVDRYYTAPGTDRYVETRSVGCRVRAANRAGTTPWSDADVVPAY